MDLFGVPPPIVDTSLLQPSSFFRLGGGDADIPLVQPQEQLPGMIHSRSIRRGRPFPQYHLMNDNLQGYTDLTDFATLTDSSNSDTDSSSDYHGSFSQGPPPLRSNLPQGQHLNLAEQLIFSSSNIPPIERISIIADEYDMSSSSGSDVTDLHSHHHFIDPNLYPLQQQWRVGNDDDQEYYFEIQSLDSCFVPDIHPPRPLHDDDRPNQHTHYRLTLLTQRLRESKMAVPFSLSRFRRYNKGISEEETETEVSNSYNDDIIVQAEPVLVP
jgi:hypothetical protein